MQTAAERQSIGLDLDSLGQALGPGGLHQFLDQAIVQPVLMKEAGAMKRQEQISADMNRDACISPKGFFAVEASIDAFAFHDTVQREGIESMGDEELMNDLAKRAPIMVRSKPRSSSVIMPATKYTRIETPGAGLREMRRKMGRVTYGEGAGL